MTPPCSRTARAVLTGALLLGAVGTVTEASAAARRPVVKPVCNLVTDPTGDYDKTFAKPSTDIVSADIAIDAKALTWVVRTAGPITDTEPARLGRQWLFRFTAVGKSHTFSVHSGAIGLRDQSNAGAKVSLDSTGRELRYTLTLAQFLAYAKVAITPGKSVLTGISAYLAVGVDYAMNQAQVPNGGDSAAGKSSYLAGRASCVKPGV